MPLRDHFHPPLHGPRDWHSFHHAWASTIAFDLNTRLPSGYFAEPNVMYGIEIDVAAWKDTELEPPAGSWSPPNPVMNVPFTIITDIVEVQVYKDDGDVVLSGALEIISPSNKDRPRERDAFVCKCIAYLQQGVGVLIVDIVTTRKANLHQEMLTRLEKGEMAADAPALYSAAYRPLQRDGDTSMDVWHSPLSLGGVLPTMPLWLRGALCLPIDLEATYERTCQQLRITRNGA